MRISINLASRPFVELRSFFARLRLLMVALVLVAIGLGIALHNENTKLAAANAQMEHLQAQTQAARQEKTHNEAQMRLPQNSAVLDRAHFLNRLFLAKSFSWTAVMMDLENVLPTGVQVTAIEPAVTTEGDVIIRLHVAGDRDRAVLLVRNLERSRHFLQPRLNGESAQAKDTGQGNRGAALNPGVPAGVDFEILANYNPVPPNETVAAKPGHTSETSGTVSQHRAPRMTTTPSPRDGVVLKPFKPSPSIVSAQPGGAASGGGR
jgi:type IV pilus assembly protein PilN